jgi:hypothetical protein
MHAASERQLRAQRELGRASDDRFHVERGRLLGGLIEGTRLGGVRARL